MTSSPDSATDDLSTPGDSVSVRQWHRIFVVGICMGTADAVPGVSGGTIALIAGIYERLVSAIEGVTPHEIERFVFALLPFDGTVSKQQALVIADELDAWFVLALLAGIATALVAVTRVVHVANREAPVILFGFFFGLIAASALVLWRALSIQTAFQALAGVGGFVLAFTLSGTMAVVDGGGLAVVFVAGSVASSAMILPGISGSLLLVVLGQYTRMATTLSEFVDGLLSLATGGSVARVASPATEVLAFVSGGLVGIASVARVIRRALDANRQATLAFLVAMVVGALRAPVQRIHDTVGFSNAVFSTFTVAALVGAIVLLALERAVADVDFESM